MAHVCFSFAEKPADALEYAVYNAVIKNMYVRPKVKFLVIKNLTGEFTKPQLLKMNNGLREVLPVLGKDTVFNFVVRNEKQYAIRRAFTLGVPYDLIQAKKMQEHQDWVAFNKKYPKARGVLTLSRVGFNAQKTQAMLVIAYQIYAGVGEEFAVALKKVRGTWKIQQKYSMFKN